MKPEPAGTGKILVLLPGILELSYEMERIN
jgi:hypothetical protein